MLIAVGNDPFHRIQDQTDSSSSVASRHEGPCLCLVNLQNLAREQNKTDLWFLDLDDD